MPTSLANFGKPLKKRNFPVACNNRTSQERYILEFPDSIQIKSIPTNMDYDDGVIKYTSRYKLDGLTLEVRRELQVDRLSLVCSNEDNEQWKGLFKVLQRDLRAQVIYQ